jgi:hypothetical protein
MQQLDDYTPTIPDSVTAHYLARSGTVYLLLDVMRPVLPLCFCPFLHYRCGFPLVVMSFVLLSSKFTDIVKVWVTFVFSIADACCFCLLLLVSIYL